MANIKPLKRDAFISDCDTYRYMLSRDLHVFGLTYAWFGINPSTANADVDDNTIHKMMHFSFREGGKKLIVGNAFAYRTKDVKRLRWADDPVGPINDEYIQSIIGEADVLIPCWGSPQKIASKLRPRLDELKAMLRRSGKPMKCLGTTMSGDPKHPLYIAKDTRFKGFY